MKLLNSGLSDEEFLKECRLLEIGPVVSRLCEIIEEYEHEFSSLKFSHGLDDSLEINGQSIDEYIREQDYQITCLNDDLKEANRKIDYLSVRTITQLLADAENRASQARQEKNQAEQSIRTLREELHDAQVAETKAKERLDMWSLLNTGRKATA